MNERTSDKISIMRPGDVSPKEINLIKFAYQNEHQKIFNFLQSQPDTDIINLTDKRLYTCNDK